MYKKFYQFLVACIIHINRIDLVKSKLCNFRPTGKKCLWLAPKTYSVPRAVS